MVVPSVNPPARVLVVEDEALIALVLQDMLEELGWEVVGPASTLAEARTLADDTESYDLALLDVRLNGETVFPVAERIVAAGRPIIFATGSGGDDLPSSIRASSVLGKPYAAQTVERAILKAIDEARTVHAS
jgi:CheY-like chemotaxis protein